MKRLIIIASILILCTSCVSPKELKKDEIPILRNWDDVFSLVEILPHDDTSFTEGLFIFNGNLYESTGLNGQSKLLKYNQTNTNDILEKQEFAEAIFAEGSTVLDDILYLLTWDNGLVVSFEPETLELIGVNEYSREGWGLTTDGINLIASDGTDCLYFMDTNFHTIKELNIYCNDEAITNINELEYDDKYILANVWLQKYIIVIEPKTGEVVMKIDFSDLLPDNAIGDSVLNGIAYDGTYYYFTGKNWNVIYKMKLLEK